MALSTGWFVTLAIAAAIIGFVINNPSPPPSPLLHAAYHGDLVTIERLAPLESTRRKSNEPKDQGFIDHVQREVNVRDQWNNTALHWAAKSGGRNTIAIVKHLLAAGINATATNNGGSTALHWACSLENGELSVELIHLLIDHGLSVHSSNRAGETPLHWAVDWIRPMAVSELVDLGAEVNRKDQEGNTPLHKIKKDCHESKECTAIVARLLRGGADVSLKNNFNRIPLQYFNQDKEQQDATQAAELQERMRREKQQGEPTATDEIDPNKPPLIRQNAMSPDQIEKIQAQFEEFKKNMTEGVLDQDRAAKAEEEQRKLRQEEDLEEEEE